MLTFKGTVYDMDRAEGKLQAAISRLARKHLPFMGIRLPRHRRCTPRRRADGRYTAWRIRTQRLPSLRRLRHKSSRKEGVPKALLLFLVSHSQAKSNFQTGNFIKDEYTHTLRLESELSDLRVGYANPYSKCEHFECARCGYGTKIKT